VIEGIIKGKRSEPLRILIYGSEGIGKSTWACQAPSPIVIPTEDGLGGLEVDSFTLAHSTGDVLHAIGQLYDEEHDYHTVVVDSMDWLEALIWLDVCRAANASDIAAIPYARGYSASAKSLKNVIDRLDDLRAHGMTVIMTAHAAVERFNDPMSDPYDRYRLKLHKTAAALLFEWCDVVGFATHDHIMKVSDVGFGQKTQRAISSGRVLRLTGCAAWAAKNRCDLPDKLPLAWSAFEAALTAAKGA
jgi:hypothetical protein